MWLCEKWLNWLNKLNRNKQSRASTSEISFHTWGKVLFMSYILIGLGLKVRWVAASNPIHPKLLISIKALHTDVDVITLYGLTVLNKIKIQQEYGKDVGCFLPYLIHK
jgi:hypothetical protein